MKYQNGKIYKILNSETADTYIYIYWFINTEIK